MFFILMNIMRGCRRRTEGPDPFEKDKALWLLCNTSPDPLENFKATKVAFNAGPSSAHQQNAIKMTFRRRAADEPLLVTIGCSQGSRGKTLSELS